MAWCFNNIPAGKDNTNKGKSFYVTVPENSFTIVPIFQGTASYYWELWMHVEGVGEIQVWKKGDNLGYRTAAGGALSSPGTSNAGIAKAAYEVEAPTYTFSGLPQGASMYYYLKSWNSVSAYNNDADKTHYNKQTSLNQMMISLNATAGGCPVPADVPAGYNVTIIGCEDNDKTNSDHDFEDLVFLSYGLPPSVDPEEYYSYITKRYMLEDLGSTDDFDFNDIVVDVTQESKTTITYKLVNGVKTKDTGEYHMKKRIPAVMTAVLLAVSTAACGGSGTAETGSTGQAPSETAAYYTDQIITPSEFASYDEFSLGEMRIVDGSVRAYGYAYDEDYNLTSFLCSFQPDGSDFRLQELDTGDNSIDYTAIDADGNFYMVLSSYSGQGEEEEDASWADTAAEFADEDADPDAMEGAMEESMEYTLEKRDQNGQVLFSVPLDVADASSEEDGADTYAIVTSMVYVDGAGLFMADEKGVGLYSVEDGSLISRVKGTEEMQEIQMFRMREGDILLSYLDGGDPAMAVLRGGSSPALEELPAGDSAVDLFNYTLFPGNSSDLLLTNSVGLYSWNLGDKEPARILQFMDVDMDAAYVSAVTFTEDGSILLMSGSSDAGCDIHLLTPSDTDLMADREEITLGCYYVDPTVRHKVIDFNKTNQEYKITIRDYSSYDDLGDEAAAMTGGEEALNNDIISGNVPDILLIPESMDAQNYTSKGVFEDLAPYMEQDEEISGTEYLTNIFDACNPEDGTYIIVPSFNLIGIAGRTEDVGEDHAISIPELMALADEKGVQYSNIFGQDVRSTIFFSALQLNGSEFIDVAAGEASFDSPEFEAILELAAEFPEEMDYSEDQEMEDTTDWYRSGRSLLQERYFSSFDEFNNAEKGDFGSEICVMGFPAEKAVGPAVIPELQITMSSASKVKDGAWQFIRQFLLEDHQASITYSFPVSRKALDLLAQDAMTQKYVENEDGEQVPDELIYYVGGQEVRITVMTEEEAGRVLDLLTSVDHRLYQNEDVLAIVEEEAAAYFAGEKTAEETAQIIQSRIQIYISESN